MNKLDPSETIGLQEALEEIFRERTSNKKIIRLDRKCSDYTSSFPLEELTIVFDDGQTLELVFKNLDPQSLTPEAREAKPKFLLDPVREILVYRDVLAKADLGTAEYYGSIIDLTASRYWLFLERVTGKELYQVGDFSIWQEAARWLAKMHNRLADLRGDEQPFIRYRADYYQFWMDRAIAFWETWWRDSRIGLKDLVRLSNVYPQIVEQLETLPVTLVHGEFYASNILVRENNSADRMCPVDWERVALAPGALDVAALVAGNWTEQQKYELAMHYHQHLIGEGQNSRQRDEFLRALYLSRLHLAVQWLGWSATWSPPREHRQDWLAEAIYVARRLGHAV